MPLPIDLLRLRIKNEVDMCQRELRHHFSISDPTLASFPVMVCVTLLRVPGPDWEEGKVVHRFVHRLAVIISEEYPVEKPIVKWQTPIFHPNIMTPQDGGYVCTKLLENWGFSSNLATFIKGIESLLANPNPKSPFGNDTCTRAAAYFNRNKYAPPLVMNQSDRRIRIVGDADG